MIPILISRPRDYQEKKKVKKGIKVSFSNGTHPTSHQMSPRLYMYVQTSRSPFQSAINVHLRELREAVEEKWRSSHAMQDCTQTPKDQTAQLLFGL